MSSLYKLTSSIVNCYFCLLDFLNITFYSVVSFKFVVDHKIWFLIYVLSLSSLSEIRGATEYRFKHKVTILEPAGNPCLPYRHFTRLSNPRLDLKLTFERVAPLLI